MFNGKNGSERKFSLADTPLKSMSIYGKLHPRSFSCIGCTINKFMYSYVG